MDKRSVGKIATALLAVALLWGSLGDAQAARGYQASPAEPTTAADTRLATYFVETGHNLALGFRDYWQGHGGQAAFGLPITEEFRQTNAADGNEYTVQYFERARFEYHPEISDPQYQVSLGFLGREAAAQAAVNTDPAPIAAGASYFRTTGHNLGGAFLSYWRLNGGLNRFGYPISEEQRDGPGRATQYFERAEFVYYPELAVTGDDVQMMPLGYDALVGSGMATPSGELVQMWPPTLAQGRTMMVRVGAAAGATIGGSYDGRDLLWQRDDNPPYPGYWTLISAAALGGLGNHHLAFKITESDGTVRQFSRNISVYAWKFPVQNLDLNPEMSGLLSPELEAKEQAAMDAAMDDTEPQQLWNGAFLTPLKQYVVTTQFGQRRGYNGGPVSTYHTGIDMAAPQGSIVAAAANGRVVFAGTLPERGNCIILDHGMGVHSVYAHLSLLAVKYGANVTQGQLIGRVGSTGFSTGPHLHWEVRLGHTPVDPNEWVNGVWPQVGE